MAKVTERYATAANGPVVICDYSPPRSGNPAALNAVGALPADFISVAYNPGKAVRTDPVVAAFKIKQSGGADVVFNLGTRDMNRLALQSHLLGAQMLGLENLLAVQGDPFNERELALVKSVGDYTATGLIESIRELNRGVDYRGLKLRTPCDFCCGASIDLGRPLEREARLTQRKIAAGAQFFVSQPIFDLSLRERFLEAYRRLAGEELAAPVFWGLQVLAPDGIVFGEVPEQIKSELERGREGVEIAQELLQSFLASGVKGVYLVPSILKGGARGYEAAAHVLAPRGARSAAVKGA